MTDGLRKSHLRKAPQVGLSEVGLPEGNHFDFKDVILMICFAFAVVGTKQQFTLAQHLSPILKISIKM